MLGKAPSPSTLLPSETEGEIHHYIYVWKILEGLVPNVGLKETKSSRRGRLCVIRHSQAEQCPPLQLHPKVCNLRDLGNVSIDTFKYHLDKWLAGVPDRPPTPGYANSNSNTLPEVVLEARRDRVKQTLHEWSPASAQTLRRVSSKVSKAKVMVKVLPFLYSSFCSLASG